METATLIFRNPNDKTVYEFLEKQRVPVKRAVIVEETGIKRTTVYDVLIRLKQKGLIDSRQLNLSKKKGRPPVFWALEKAWEFYDKWNLHARSMDQMELTYRPRELLKDVME